MKNNKLHIILSILVLCCYFSALTPVHFLFHFNSEREHHHCDSSHSDSDENKTTCFFCNAIVSGQNTHLFEAYELDFSTIIISSKVEKILSQINIPSLPDTAYFSLRAPPCY
ncbi:hypothetical protein [Capnocytophaga catalasegens]|uniref:DUF2946 domain-containing protein n=1 Tax=Capnocytophaga catalasegens TaxID=1004260 RepID=A0AAV5AZ29_9FLAO|nr:hypothetical protein [Capnocytophaga catalasegens]GIZ14635.1 hypothetical protein RCZ03_06360 [Capnocytophaga catalasegens]GJM50837.1 hypothetical protein RCZ15_18100 [Capnocytophaga catalasegens]GJM51990.1 hypothetical protein RCZ16_03080 [Capnocytophaga catalasegens]